jgi:hypothetical protein
MTASMPIRRGESADPPGFGQPGGELRKWARKNDVHFEVIEDRGKGAHCRVELGSRNTITAVKIIRNLDFIRLKTIF